MLKHPAVLHQTIITIPILWNHHLVCSNKFPMKSNSSDISVSNAAAFPSNMQANSKRLTIIAQPTYGPKLRYRSDYEKYENRLGVLKNKNTGSSYQGPAISVSLLYHLNFYKPFSLIRFQQII